uniref:Uncharacterized protein n=1 Tax=Arundo donax TaxID=35708 RepID=A0A0A9SS70_ARUDO
MHYPWLSSVQQHCLNRTFFSVIPMPHAHLEYNLLMLSRVYNSIAYLIL